MQTLAIDQDLQAHVTKALADCSLFRALKPEHIAPLVVYLASDQAKDVSGQVFGVRGNEIYLFSQPRPVRTLKQPQGWTPETIAKAMQGEARDALTPLEGTSEYFNWDAV